MPGGGGSEGVLLPVERLGIFPFLGVRCQVTGGR